MNEKIQLTAQVSARIPDEDHRDARRFCPKCGREIPLDRQICVICGNTGEIPRPQASKKNRLLTLLLIALVSVMFIFLLIWFTKHLPETAAESTLTQTPLFPNISGTSIPVTLIP